MSKNYVWVCNDCLPEGTEVKSLGHIGPGQCHVCTGTYESGKLNYLDRETADSLARVYRTLHNPHEKHFDG